MDDNQIQEEIRSFPAKVFTRDQNNAPVEGAYVFSAEISSTRVDAYFTHMTEKTLSNFEQDAKKGIQFLDSHNSRLLGYGRSYDARLEQGEISRVVVDFYTVPGIRLNNQTYQSTDDFIRALQGGLVNDVSVGFYGGQHLCDICGAPMRSFGFFGSFPECDHWPGEKYVVEENGKDVPKLSTYSIDDAHLAEASGVYKGATPEAQIITRANEAIRSGKLDKGTVEKIKKYYQIDIRSNKKMDELEKIRSVLEELDVEGESVVDRLVFLVEENTRLHQLAEEGKKYRSDLIESALEEGVRASGNDFAREAYEEMFKSASLDHIKHLRDFWQKQGDLILAGEGRHTVDKPEKKKEKEQPKKRTIPMRAYS